MITTIYRVAVIIPDVVWVAFGETQRYEHLINEAIRGNVGAGHYSNDRWEVEEWAEFHSLAEAQRCEYEFKAVVRQLLKESQCD